MDVSRQIWHELAGPRAPTEAERRLLGVLSAAVGDPVLDDQVASAVVDAVCRCGCSSVRLRSDRPPLSAGRARQLSGRGRSDHLAVGADGSAPGHEHVQVVLHVVLGRVQELEVFDFLGGEGVPVALEEITGLDAPEVS